MRRNFFQLAVIFTFLAAACRDSTAPPTAATIEARSGLVGVAFPGAPVAADPEVLVRDQNGEPIAGVTVTFAVTTGGGSVANSTTTSGPQGTATAGIATAGIWTLGQDLGANTLVGTVAGVGSVEFRAEAIPVPTGRFELTTMDGIPLPVAVADAFASLTAGTFTLNSDGTFTESREWRDDQERVSRYESSGRFSPRIPEGLRFYSVSRLLWADGRIEGDTLTLKVTDNDVGGVPVTYVYVSPSSAPTRTANQPGR